MIFPGVPSLQLPFNFSVGGFLSGDLLTDRFNSQQPQWGIYLNGAPALVFDTFVSIDYRQGWALADYPVEGGKFESYDKVSLPFDARVKFASGGSEENRTALLDAVKAIAGTLSLYTVVTPEATYKSVNVQHYDYRRTNTNGVGLISVELWFLEVRVVTSASYVPDNSYTTGSANATNPVSTNPDTASAFETGAPPLTDTKYPEGMSSFNRGVIQPTIPSSSLYSAFVLQGIE